ncbi:hypothetical protein BT63DRAFT_101077 [Microthyrium microscopicum]|uniref:C2H2-type domain-containing protein n=1 Tax=Microthyrium microscopicum TaxID=703497 RepID=A0A6A6TZ19_9PEZI|nr:hypothetical protein BT63DRAFT_101077 [Microthyrium microscopicum]
MSKVNLHCLQYVQLSSDGLSYAWTNLRLTNDQNPVDYDSMDCMDDSSTLISYAGTPQDYISWEDIQLQSSLPEQSTPGSECSNSTWNDSATLPSSPTPFVDNYPKPRRSVARPTLIPRDPKPVTTRQGRGRNNPNYISPPPASIDFDEEGEIKHGCPDCSKSFAKHHQYSKHYNTHSRPYKCKHVDCDSHTKGFAVRRDRDRHEKTRHGPAGSNNELPMDCFCPYSACRRSKKGNGGFFSRRDNLLRHLQRVHKEPCQQPQGKARSPNNCGP